MKAKLISFVVFLIILSTTLFAQDASSTGTGFFISNDGLLVTCAHVVETGTRIVVHINNQEYPAQLISKNTDTDLAILKINYNNPYFFTVKNFDAVQLGESVKVLGYPLTQLLGDDVRLTDGIVSAKSGLGADPTYFQISAPIQPGNSGGPIFTNDFSVIGVAAAKLNDRLVYENIGSIPQNVNFGVKSNHINALLGNRRLLNGNIRTMDDATRAVVLISVYTHFQPDSSSITITNRTGYMIYYVYVSPTSDDKWGHDRLGSSVLDNNSSFAVGGLSFRDNRYDIRLVDSDGDSYTKLNLPLQANQNVVFTFADFDKEDEPVEQLPHIVIENSTGYTVYFLYVSPSSQSTWGSDVLGEEILSNGSYVTVSLPYPLSTENRYDIRLEDSDGDTYTKANVLITPNMRIVFRITDLD